MGFHQSFETTPSPSKKFVVATMIEVVEHVNLEDNAALMRNVLGGLQPDILFVSTPNRDFNKFFGMQSEDPSASDYKLRHWDHRFEFT